jgi:Asp-tRNA(Asn)/Glu-tRNA(Gln) amidotransferase A subunit family amidase
VRIGYFESYDTMPATAPMRRALEIGRAALEKQGYKLVKIEFSQEDIREAGQIYTGLVMSHIISPILNRISENYDDILPCYKYSVILLRSGYIVRNLFILLLRITGNARIANAVQKCKKLDFHETSGFLERQKDLQLKMVRLWKAWGIEAILQPSYASVAFKHANAADMGVFLDYLNFWSLLHYPAGVVPVGTVAPGEDTGYVDTFDDKWSRIIRRDIKGSVGMPISVTIVAQPYEDEVAIGVMQRLDEEVAFHMSPKL